MFLHFLRALFVLMMGAVGWFVLSTTQAFHDYTWLALAGTLIIAVAVVCIDILAPRSKLQIFSGTFLGLFAGLLVAYGLSFIVRLLTDQYFDIGSINSKTNHNDALTAINLVIGLICCYLCISFVLQTKDDFRFIVPYVEFSKQTKGNRPLLLDTSALIDGRINDIVATGIIESQLVVPRFILEELQTIADSADGSKRHRGRRGLDVLTRLRDTRRIDVTIYDSSLHEREETASMSVDQKLLALARQLKARIITSDFNLNKVAQLSGVDVININDLSNALKPILLPGERLTIKILSAGEGEGQGVGYLEDGTMVVVEQARQYLGADVEFAVSRVIQTSAGRMIFGRLADAPDSAGRRSRPTRQPPGEPADDAPLLHARLRTSLHRVEYFRAARWTIIGNNQSPHPPRGLIETAQ